jgi:hypothetical protein
MTPLAQHPTLSISSSSEAGGMHLLLHGDLDRDTS